MPDPSYYIDPSALQRAIVEGRNEEIGAALLLMATRIVRSKSLPPGLDVDDVIATAAMELWQKLHRIDHSRGPGAVFNYCTGSILLTCKNMAKISAYRNSRCGPFPDDYRDDAHRYD